MRDGEERRRRHPLSLTDRQLEAVAAALAWVLADRDHMDGRQRARIREARRRVDVELTSRGLADGAGRVRYTYSRSGSWRLPDA